MPVGEKKVEAGKPQGHPSRYPRHRREIIANHYYESFLLFDEQHKSWHFFFSPNNSCFCFAFFLQWVAGMQSREQDTKENEFLWLADPHQIFHSCRRTDNELHNLKQQKNQSRKSVWRNVWPFPVHSTSFKGHSQGKAGLFLLKRSQSQVANRTQVLITDLAKTWRWRQIADLKPVSWKPTVLAYCFGK